MSDLDQGQARPSLDLRSFRQSLEPRKTLGQVARGAQVDKSLLSRIAEGGEGPTGPLQPVGGLTSALAGQGGRARQ